MQGARAVGAHALTYSRAAQFVEPALVDGAVGLAIVPHGRLIGALGFTLKGGKITEIDLISDAGHLRHVDLTALGGLTARPPA
jgi:RNA polymerase sigma-70 factor (ECF subfamily)